MKRTLLLMVVVSMLSVVLVSGRTQASGIFPGSIGGGPAYGSPGPCVSLPKQTPCPTATPNVLTALSPVKVMSVSAPIAGPYGVDNYPINVISQIGCFSLTEPILVSALGNHGEAVFRQVSPPVVGGNPYEAVVQVSSTGTAALSMEVWSSQVGPAGLVVKAVWPEEGVEQLQTVIPPTAPTGTAVVATLAPTSVPATSAGTPAATATPAPTVTSTPVPLTVSTCYSRATSAIDIRSVPGASCTLAVTFNGGTAVVSNPGPFIIPPTGVGEDPFVAPAGATSGAAVTTCTLNGETVTDTLNLALPTPTPVPSPTTP